MYIPKMPLPHHLESSPAPLDAEFSTSPQTGAGPRRSERPDMSDADGDFDNEPDGDLQEVEDGTDGTKRQDVGQMRGITAV